LNLILTISVDESIILIFNFVYPSQDGESESIIFCVHVQLLKPDPMVVATKLLARRTYKDTGKQFNVIAASWIQFMIHDWIDHLEDTNQVLILYLRIYL